MNSRVPLQCDIAAWRAAFSAFGAMTGRYPSSAEALTGRVLKGQPLPRVNAIVDLDNSVSVRHVVPLGARTLIGSNLRSCLRTCRVGSGDGGADVATGSS